MVPHQRMTGDHTQPGHIDVADIPPLPHSRALEQHLISRPCATDETNANTLDIDHPELICYSFFGIKFCDSSILYQQLAIMNKQKYADILQYLQLATYIILVFGTVGVKVFLQSINKDKISLEEKLFSRFSLIIKNVPLYYQIEDLKE